VRIDYLFLHAACSWSIASVNRRKVRRRCSWAGAESAVQDPADPRPGPCSSLVLFLLLFYFLDLISVNAHAAHGLIFGRDHLFLSLTPMVCACSGFGVIGDARAARLSSKY